MRILTQSDQGVSGFHGRIGDETNMQDSFGNNLYVGDVVIVSNQNEFEKANKYLGEEYGISFVCEEKTDVANWTGQDKQYIMGIADSWNSHVFKKHLIDFQTDYWDELHKLMNGWIVHKVKDHRDLAIGERIGFLYVWDSIS